MEQPITIACATRGRPDKFARMAESVRNTASGPVNIVAGVDADDTTLRDYPRDGVRYIVSPRGTTGTAWNSCLLAGRGFGVLLLGDDAIMETPGWDKIIRERPLPADGIYVLNFTDIDPDGTEHVFNGSGWHNFIGSGWLDVTGHIAPPIFKHWYHESWNNVIARKIERLYSVPEIKIRHMFSETFEDKTNQEARTRGRKADVRAWRESQCERNREAAKLSARMKE